MSAIETELGASSDIDVIDKYLNVGSQFLIDAGCGNMHLSKQLAKRGASVLAIDPDVRQAKKNRECSTIPNVGFAETGADEIPVESSHTNGVLFPYSFHHIPPELHESVCCEVSRILKPDGFIYIMEPVAAGAHNDVMRLFHDEEAVRRTAQESIDKYFIPAFAEAQIIRYHNTVSYDSWEHFAKRYVGKTYNAGYSEADVRNEAVKEAFEQAGKLSDYVFKSPMKVTLLRNPTT